MRAKFQKYTGAAFRVAPVFLCMLMLVACTPRPKELVFGGPIMGTEYHVKCVDTRRVLDQDTLHNTVLNALQKVDSLMSTYKPESELSRFNAHRDTSPFPLSPDTFNVFEIALQLSEMSGGAFDITVAPLINAHGFGPDSAGVPPAENTVASLKEFVGYHLLELNAEAQSIRKKDPRVYCDLSAVAKGYAVDLATETLEKLGVENYMVEVGGEIRVKGRNIEGKPWRIAIEAPEETMRKVHHIVPLGASTAYSAMATSGDYRNFYMENDRRVSHTFDPRTGQSSTHNLASATVLHHNCAWADALATTLMVLGPEEGLAFAKKHNLAAYLITRTPEGFQNLQTPHFPSAHP